MNMAYWADYIHVVLFTRLILKSKKEENFTSIPGGPIFPGFPV